MESRVDVLIADDWRCIPLWLELVMIVWSTCVQLREASRALTGPDGRRQTPIFPFPILGSTKITATRLAN